MLQQQNHPFLSHEQQHQQQQTTQQNQQQQQQQQQHLHQQHLKHQQETNTEEVLSSSGASSNNSSISGGSPQERVSPASTALIMSSNNINGQSYSRQLTPNTNSSNQGGTNSSRDTGPSNSPRPVQPNMHPNQNRAQAPNPSVRQFASCHTKSMSAGIVVSVPGLSNNNLGGHRNIIVPNSHHPPNPHRPLPLDPEQHQMQHHNQINMKLHQQHSKTSHHPAINGSSSSAIHHHTRSGGSINTRNSLQQQVIREHPTLNRNQPHKLQDHHFMEPQQLQQQNQELEQHTRQQSNGKNHHHLQPYQYHLQQQNKNQFNNDHRQHQNSSSSIILSNQNINQVHHNRSASAQLANHHQHHHDNIMNHHHQMNLNNHHNHNHHNHNHHQRDQNQVVGSHHQLATSNGNSRDLCRVTQTNSIWSIDENMSKSQGKLTGTGFISHPTCLFNSITDMSCDNVSNASRLIDGSTGLPPPPPTSAYLMHHNATRTLANSATISTSGHSFKRPEFLPFCDLMFNFISMITYFCENTFGIIALIALYYHSQYANYALVGAFFVIASNFICQYLSFKWLYKAKLDECRRKREAQEELEDEENCERRFYNGGLSNNIQTYQCGSCSWLPYNATELQIKFLLTILLDGLIHIFCAGFLLRYIKLVIPITDNTRVKRDARDLCILRMVHGFVQSIPLLLLQSYIICSQVSPITITNLNITSAVLSLINVCWALASFTKYSRKKFIHKFVLTWLGIITQFMWRLGTITSRVTALTIYAVYFGYWMIVVLILHWFVMFVWLMKPGNLFKDEPNMLTSKKGVCAAAVAWIYCFCYVNFEEVNSQLKMISYYAISFMENNLLLTVSLIFSTNSGWFKNVSILVVYLGFVVGIAFMVLYYKYLHASVLNNGLSCSNESIDSIADQLTSAGKKIAGFKPGTLRLKSDENFSTSNRFNTNMDATLHTGSHPEIARSIKRPCFTSHQLSSAQSGVFNCRLNSGIRKQKMPSSHQKRN